MDQIIAVLNNASIFSQTFLTLHGKLVVEQSA